MPFNYGATILSSFFHFVTAGHQVSGFLTALLQNQVTGGADPGLESPDL